MTRRLFQHSTMMQNTSHVAVRHIRIDAAFFHDFEVVQREKAAVRTHLSRRLATLVLHLVHHRHQQSVVVQFPADLLCHDQMIVAHRQRCRVAQRESPAVRQKAAVRVSTRKLPHSGLFQPLQPHGNLPKLSFELLHRRARHFQPGSFIRIFARALLLPPPNVLADLGSFRSQLFQGLRGARGACETRSAPKNPAAPLPPNSETPNLPESAAPAAANWSSPARRRTATPSAAAPDDRPDALRRYSPLQAPANPASPPRHARKSKDALLPALLSRLVAANRLAPGCTPENWPFRAPPLPPV